MYDKCVVGAGGVGGAGCLAQTGISPIWAILAGFALLAVGTAIMRIIPRRTATR
ncbi:LPXTG cell wall anchor domain-containing protein [Jiangella rhizosphaerae]|uniref:LPXTG cell wall anchor domain-containing protein n=2 Tax=Jiangella rhizosphaerae TaxID=2293569 RepID=A0A418KLV4_9ACTN|nr:LPXTG cell wall anchor domain-containing protein [Jiangella rhizosphaerae]